ncbi:hypothetical protein SEPCBS119000_005555 [Sporothrix epigloea]|uniref:Putative zinc-finger domain-containing protein n=1 Tax=Sporothrix epigloea TaxID=1892477 RepID=A0ABP0DY77_9PEZI
MESPGQRSPNAVGGDLSWSEAFPTAVTAAAPFAYPAHQPPSHQAYPHQQVYPQHYQSHRTHVQTPQQAVTAAQAYRVPPDAGREYDMNTAAITRSSELEEGELSDDDEDPYEPEEESRTESDNAMDLVENGSPQLAMGHVADLPSRDASVIDTQDDAFYDDEDEDKEAGEIKSIQTFRSASDAAVAVGGEVERSELESKSLPAAPDKRADSYSPSLSLGNAERNGGTAKGEAQFLGSAAATATATAQATTDAVNGKSTKSGTDRNSGRELSAVTEQSVLSKKLPYSTVDDAKKEAQRAILRLIPYGVNYQTYIDEGFDKGLIMSLFAELGLKASPNETLPTQRSISPIETAEAIASPSEPTGDGSATKKEERKDRIARLLALRASKPAHVSLNEPPAVNLTEPPAISPIEPPAVNSIEPSVVNPIEPPAINSIQSPAESPIETPAATPNATKAKSKTALLLQQRLKALKQAQEQRAAAATKAAEKPITIDNKLPEQHSQAATVLTRPNADKPVTESIAPPAMPPVSSRQRPVAADFDDALPPSLAQSPHGTLKRPTELMRQRSSVFIEVSDESADEDVDMELESQADDSARASGLPVRQSERLPSYDDNKIGESNGNLFSHDTLAVGPHLSPEPLNGGQTPPNVPAGTLSHLSGDEYTKKMRAIEFMKRRIAEAEAKKAHGTPTGLLTPHKKSMQTLPDNENSGQDSSSSNSSVASLAVRSHQQSPQRTMSAVELEFREQSRAGSPLASIEPLLEHPVKRNDVASTAPSGEYHRAKRMRLASLQLPSIEANLREKMFKLRLLQDKVAALQVEIDAGVAEKLRLTEDVEEVVMGSEDLGQELDATMQPNLQLEAAQTGDGSEQDQNDVSDGKAEMDASMDVAAAAAAAAADAEQSDSGDSGSLSQAEGDPSVAESVAESAVGPVAEPGAISSATTPHSPASRINDGDIEMAEKDASEEENQEEIGEVPDTGVELVYGESQRQREQLATRPATVAEPAVAGVKAGTLPPTLVPYESPLRYFRSFRYHPQYSVFVPSGYRSLTFSGKIQDDVVLCPTETAGESCREAACRFQHFATMVPRDDQILVELGRADDYTGEQKSRFVDGLTSLLKKIRDEKERDFVKIAQSIIDFRRAFLGDDTRIVSHLEGVAV